MSGWYSRRLAHGPNGFAALTYLRKLGGELEGLTPCDQFYRIALDVETTDIVVFIEPGHAELAFQFGAEPCEKPQFGAGLRDVSVPRLPGGGGS